MAKNENNYIAISLHMSTFYINAIVNNFIILTNQSRKKTEETKVRRGLDKHVNRPAVITVTKVNSPHPSALFAVANTALHLY